MPICCLFQPKWARARGSSKAASACFSSEGGATSRSVQWGGRGVTAATSRQRCLLVHRRVTLRRSTLRHRRCRSAVPTVWGASTCECDGGASLSLASRNATPAPTFRLVSGAEGAAHPRHAHQNGACLHRTHHVAINPRGHGRGHRTHASGYRGAGDAVDALELRKEGGGEKRGGVGGWLNSAASNPRVRANREGSAYYAP